MNPVYRRFFEIEDSVRENRIATRERAIANGWDTKINEDGRLISDNGEAAPSDTRQVTDAEAQPVEDFKTQNETEPASSSDLPHNNMAVLPYKTGFHIFHASQVSLPFALHACSYN